MHDRDTPPAPPRAPARPRRSEAHGDQRVDPYAWLRDPAYPEVKDPEIRAYLEAENAYVEAIMAPQAALRETLIAELKARLKPDESTVPRRQGRFWYQSRYAPGAQYPVHVRRAGSRAAPDEAAPEALLLDEPALAAGKPFLSIGTWEPSPDGTLLAWSADEDGSERYVVHVKDVAAGTVLADRLANASGALVWSADSRHLFYASLDDKLRPTRILCHRLGSPQADDRLVYEETEQRFWMSIGATSDERFLVIAARDKETAEVRVLDLAAPDGAPRVVVPRRDGHDYALDHHPGPGGSAPGVFYVRTNDRGRDFRIVAAPDDDPAEARWTEVVPHVADRYISGMQVFERHLVAFEREGGLPQVRVRDLASGAEHRVAFPDAVYMVFGSGNSAFDTATLRLSYQSLARPLTVYDYDMDARGLVTRKVQEIPSGFDPSAYVTERIFARSADGTAVPVSLAYRRGTPRDGTAPLYLYGYGAYGITFDPSFSPHRFSLIDRGFVFAMAHPRGGSDLGRAWYDGGKLAQKRNTFADMIAIAEHLVALRCTGAGRITVSGGSAGGLMVGAVVNERPDLFRAAVARVPFVDALNTMLDPSLPLTPTEYTEWGNPSADKAAYDLIKSYSPYDNVRAQAYPHMLVTAGIADPRVTYWEPAKWVARLRATKTDANLLLLHTNMAAGHRGATGRFEALKELALEYAFLLKVYGMA
ncbi:MAG: S9 family peptidase [Alphaproteobacteria bacterium]|nr:S9 family peptidase [Alphaproteobacteria bacterium]